MSQYNQLLSTINFVFQEFIFCVDNLIKMSNFYYGYLSISQIKKFTWQHWISVLPEIMRINIYGVYFQGLAGF